MTTHTGNEPPYGYLDWWPNSLWMNTQLAPYSDPQRPPGHEPDDRPRQDQRGHL